MEQLAETVFPRRVALYQAWLKVLQEAASDSEDASITLAGRLKSLANQEKNARGQIRGIARGRFLESQRLLERRVAKWARGQSELSEVELSQLEPALQELGEAVRRRARSDGDRDFLLRHTTQGPLHLKLALDLVRGAEEREKPDLDRLPDFQERNWERRRRIQERDQKRLHPTAEAGLLEDFLNRCVELPEAQRLPSVESLLGEERSPAAIRCAVVGLARETRIWDLAERRKMFEETVDELRARQDSLLGFAFDFAQDLRDHEERDDARRGLSARLRPVWRRGLQAYLGRPLDADANGTLRVSLAQVRGYGPRDGVWMKPRTRVAGLVEKHTGEDPFEAPPELLASAPSAGESAWADPQWADVPVCFLATGDTTGGNSGSPVIDGRGRLVGVNFDRVWENVANDFGYNSEVARNVSVDVRYLLWMLDVVERRRSGGAERAGAISALMTELLGSS